MNTDPRAMAAELRLHLPADTPIAITPQFALAIADALDQHGRTADHDASTRREIEHARALEQVLSRNETLAAQLCTAIDEKRAWRLDCDRIASERDLAERNLAAARIFLDRIGRRLDFERALKTIKPRVIHMAALVCGDGKISPKCASEPTPIDMAQESWTMRREAVTCEACLIKLESGSGVHGDAADDPCALKVGAEQPFDSAAPGVTASGGPVSSPGSTPGPLPDSSPERATTDPMARPLPDSPAQTKVRESAARERMNALAADHGFVVDPHDIDLMLLGAESTAEANKPSAPPELEEKLREVEVLFAAATQGPFSVGRVLQTPKTKSFSTAQLNEAMQRELRCVFAGFTSSDAGRSRMLVCEAREPQDAALIAKALQAVPGLIFIIRSLAAEKQALLLDVKGADEQIERLCTQVPAGLDEAIQADLGEK